MMNTVADAAVSTILVVEDEPLTRAMMSDELRTTGYAVLEADNADEALAIVRSGISIEIVITDMQMPGTLDGNGLIQRVRMERPSLKVVMVSGRSPEPAIVPLLDGYLAKPIEPSQVGGCVRALASAHDQPPPIPSPSIPASQEEAVPVSAIVAE